jgi:hypothetical protein
MASGLDVLVGSYRRSMRFPSLIERPLMIQRVVPTRGVSRKLPRLVSLRACHRRGVPGGAANAWPRQGREPYHDERSTGGLGGSYHRGLGGLGGLLYQFTRLADENRCAGRLPGRRGGPCSSRACRRPSSTGPADGSR